MTVTAAQCRAARALLDWTQARLAETSQVGNATIRNFESGTGVPQNSTLAAIQRALEAAGVIFVEENGEGPGVRLKKVAEAKPVRIERKDFPDYEGTLVRLDGPVGTLQRGGIQATTPTGEAGYVIVSEKGDPLQSVADHVFAVAPKFRAKNGGGGRKAKPAISDEAAVPEMPEGIAKDYDGSAI